MCSIESFSGEQQKTQGRTVSLWRRADVHQPFSHVRMASNLMPAGAARMAVRNLSCGMWVWRPGQFQAKLGPETRYNGPGSKNGAEGA